MAQPTLAYGGTTITLPYPTGESPPLRSVAEIGGERRTVGGVLRRWIGSYWYAYQLTFVDAAETTYDAIVSLIRTAAAANAYPTFTWASGPWPSATAGVSVSAHLSDMRPSDSGMFSLADFDLTLTEIDPRS